MIYTHLSNEYDKILTKQIFESTFALKGMLAILATHGKWSTLKREISLLVLNFKKKMANLKLSHSKLDN